jgi:hypothetical protein
MDMILSSFHSQARDFISEHRYKGWSDEKLIEECTAFLTKALDSHYRHYAEAIALQALAAYGSLGLGKYAYIDLKRTTGEALFIKSVFGAERREWVFTIADILKAAEEDRLVSLPIPSHLAFLEKQKKMTQSETGAD